MKYKAISYAINHPLQIIYLSSNWYESSKVGMTKLFLVWASDTDIYILILSPIFAY